MKGLTGLSPTAMWPGGGPAKGDAIMAPPYTGAPPEVPQVQCDVCDDLYDHDDPLGPQRGKPCRRCRVEEREDTP